MYVLFDGRASGGVGGFDATVLGMDENLEALEEDAKDLGGGAIYKFDKVDGVLENEEWIKDVPCR